MHVCGDDVNYPFWAQRATTRISVDMLVLWLFCLVFSLAVARTRN